MAVKEQIRKRPTGLSALAAAALVILAAKFGLDLSEYEATVFVGLVAAIVSSRTPRV